MSRHTKARGRWVPLVWFAAHEPILTPEERADILARIQADPGEYKRRSHRYWRALTVAERAA